MAPCRLHLLFFSCASVFISLAYENTTKFVNWTWINCIPLAPITSSITNVFVKFKLLIKPMSLSNKWLIMSIHTNIKSTSHSHQPPLGLCIQWICALGTVAAPVTNSALTESVLIVFVPPELVFNAKWCGGAFTIGMYFLAIRNGPKYKMVTFAMSGTDLEFALIEFVLPATLKHNWITNLWPI